MKQKVQRVVQSPMNPLRWCFELACGHNVWVTRKSRPSTMSVVTVVGEKMAVPRGMKCPECAAMAGKASTNG